MKKLIAAVKAGIKITSDRIISGQAELFGSVFFIFISAILTVLNIVRHVHIAMTIATSVLALGFLVTAVLARRRKARAAKTMIILLCGVIFSLFALIGGNDGFAILWILLVPLIGCLWVGLKFGVILSAYFQVFLILLFYTPMSGIVSDYYTPTFMLRFPLLYFASFGSITFMMWQREGLINRLNRESYYDALTGLHNRRYYNEVSEVFRMRGMRPGFTYFSFDLNRLKYANDTFGHQAGDELIVAAVSLILKNFKGAECFRIGGDEFVALATDINVEKAISGLEADSAAWSGQYMSQISISVGYARASEDPTKSFEELALLADSRMYEAKKRYYEDNGIER